MNVLATSVAQGVGQNHLEQPQKKKYTEEKAKVVAAGWRTELFLLNAAL